MAGSHSFADLIAVHRYPHKPQMCIRLIQVKSTKSGKPHTEINKFIPVFSTGGENYSQEIWVWSKGQWFHKAYD